MVAFSCPLKECDHSSDSWFDIQKHTWRIHLKKSRMCHICQKVVVHLRVHHNEYHSCDRNCPFCEKESSAFAEVHRHVSHFHTGLIGTTEPLRPVQPLNVTLLQKMRQFYIGPEFQLIVKDDFIIMFDTAKNRVVFACKTLFPQQCEGLVSNRQRPEFYSKDRGTPNYHVTSRRIKRARYQTGHLVAAQDCSYTVEAFNSTFNVLNVSPMTRSFNNGMWSALEFHNRRTGKKCNALTYFTIPIYDDLRPLVRVQGGLKLEIPVAYGKISYLEKPDEPITSQAFVMPHNRESYRESFWKYQVNHEEFETRTGRRFRQVLWTLEYNPPTFLCTTCHCYKSFVSSGALENHQAVSHPELVRCPQCQRGFETLEEANAHLQVDHPIIKCDYCEETFSCTNNKKRHEMEHTGEKQFACQEAGCDKAFKTEIELVLHTRTHTGERPYACDFPGCDWAFPTQSGLVRHKRTHTREVLYSCHFPGCGKPYSRRDSLKQHWEKNHVAHPYIPPPFIKRRFTPRQ